MFQKMAKNLFIMAFIGFFLISVSGCEDNCTGRNLDLSDSSSCRPEPSAEDPSLPQAPIPSPIPPPPPPPPAPDPLPQNLEVFRVGDAQAISNFEATPLSAAFNLEARADGALVAAEWKTSDPTIVTISAEGAFQAQALGKFSIEARFGTLVRIIPGEVIPNLVPSDSFVDSVVDFHPEGSATYGANLLPGIVLGAPGGNLDTVSVGPLGWITIKSETPVLNGPGPDFIVFENGFPGWIELGEVSVSQDGINFIPFVCQKNLGPDYPGCAGAHFTLAVPNSGLDPTDPAVAGGDAFDLQTLGLSWIQFIRITDLETQAGGMDKAGFDLDAISIIHQ